MSPVREVIAATCASIDLWGWWPSSASGFTTADTVKHLLITPPADTDKVRQGRVRLLRALMDLEGAAYRAEAEEIITWVEGLDPRTSWAVEVKRAVAGHDRAFALGLLTSAANAYRNRRT